MNDMKQGNTFNLISHPVLIFNRNFPTYSLSIFISVGILDNLYNNFPSGCADYKIYCFKKKKESEDNSRHGDTAKQEEGTSKANIISYRREKGDHKESI